MNNILPINNYWYHVNFTDEIVLFGKTVKFLRIFIPQNLFPQTNKKFYITLFPSIDSLYYNLKINDILLDKYNNIFHQYISSQNENFIIINQNIFPLPEYWYKIKPGETFEYKIEYDGSFNAKIKLFLLITDYKPEKIGNKYWFYNNIENNILKINTIIPESYNGNILEINNLKNTYHNIYNNIDNEINDNLSKDNNKPLALIDYRPIIINCISSPYEDVHQKQNYYNFKNDLVDSINIKDVIFDDKTSFMLLRTNPLLTGNIKIVIDENEDIYLDTFEANSTLSDKRFKKFKINENGNYAIDLNNFLDKGNITNDILFDVFQKKTLEKPYYNNDLSEIYDNFYFSGPRYLKSKLYNEKFSYLAPLWIRKEIPKYFIILKTEKLVNNYSLSKKEIIDDIIKNSKIIKVFDLTENSKIGKYLRNIINDNNYSLYPLFFSFKTNLPSYWYGISYKKGSLVRISENFEDFIKNDIPIKLFEKYITEGFKRNEIVSQNIFNLEFLFNDNEKEYDINRYFGFYVNDINIGELNLDINLINYYNKINLRKETKPLKKYVKGNIYLNIDDLNIDNFSYNDFQVINDKDNNFYRVKNINYEELLLPEKTVKYFNVSLYNEKIDISKFIGIHKLKKQFKTKLYEYYPTVLELEFLDKTILNNIEKIEIIDENNPSWINFEILVNENGLEEGDCWDSYYLNKNKNTYEITINIGNKIETFLKSINCAINKTKILKSYYKDNKLYILNYNNLLKSIIVKFKFVNNIDFQNKIKVFEKDIILSNTNELIFNLPNFNNKKNKKIALIDINEKNFITGEEYVQVDKNYFSKIKHDIIYNNKIYLYPNICEPVFDEKGNIKEFKNLDKYRVIIINDNKDILLNNGYLSLYEEFKPQYKILSIFPIKDFDNDYFYSEYSNINLNEIDYYFKEIVLYKNDEINLELNNYFKVKLGKGKLIKININNNIFEEDINDDELKYFNTLHHNIYSEIKVKNYEEQPLIIVKHLYNYLNNENDRISLENLDYEVINFNGFSGLQRLMNNYDYDILLQLKENKDYERFFYQFLNNEYDYLLENYNKKINYLSTVIPIYNKWVSFGTDVRNNKYRLNISNAFGLNNFSPSNDEIIDSLSFTHEYFLLDKPKIELLKYNNNFENKYKIYDGKNYTNFKINIEDFYNNDIDYFSLYFIKNEKLLEYLFNKNFYEDGYTYDNFSFINHFKDFNESWTIFKGVKYVFREYNEKLNKYIQSKKYDNYRFSVVLTLVDDTDEYKNDWYNIKIIENEKFKYIIIVISVKLQNYKFYNGIDYTSIYTSYDNNLNILTFLFNYQSIGYIHKIIHNLNYSNRCFSEDILLRNKFVGLLDYGDSEVDFNIDYQNNDIKLIKRNFDIKFNKIKGKNLFNNFNINNFISLFQSFENIKIYDYEYNKNIIVDNINPSFIAFWKNNKVIDNIINVHEKIKNFYNISYNNTINNFITSLIYQRKVNLLFIGENNNFLNETSNYHVFIKNNATKVKRKVYSLSNGKDINKEIIELLSFKLFYENINKENSKFISYETVKEDGTIEKNKFNIKIILPDNFVKLNMLLPKKNDNIPISIKNYNEVDFDYNLIDKITLLKRYSDFYEPKTKDILKFNNYYYFNNFLPNYFKRNTIISRNNDNLTIKNNLFNKISKEKLFYDDIDGQYPLINLSSFDKDDYFILSSNWDKNYYKEYIKFDKYNLIDGYLNEKDENTIFISRLINIPNKIILDNFSSDEYIFDGEIIEFDLRKIIYNRIIQKNEFIEKIKNQLSFVQNKEEIIEKYLKTNILNNFYIENINIFYNISNEYSFETLSYEKIIDLFNKKLIRKENDYDIKYDNEKVIIKVNNYYNKKIYLYITLSFK